MTFTDVLIDYVFDHDLRKYDVNKRAKIIKLSINSKNRVESKNILGLLSYLARNLNKKEIKYFEKWCDAEARSVKKQISIRDFGVKASMDLLYSTIDTQKFLKKTFN